MAFASLSSGLLARKGQARPAMRPQGFDPSIQAGAALEDLGWNDMGQEAPQPPAATSAPTIADSPGEPERPAEPTTPAEPVEPASTVVALPLARAAPGAKGKAAFTLRLDPVRHLRLRLACALKHQSAQRVVTEALDTFLAGPELDHLAAEAATHAQRS